MAQYYIERQKCQLTAFDKINKNKQNATINEIT